MENTTVTASQGLRGKIPLFGKVKRPRVLVIEDKLFALNKISKILLEADFLFYTTEYRSRVSGLLERIKPDMVLMDNAGHRAGRRKLYSSSTKDVRSEKVNIIIYLSEKDDLSWHEIGENSADYHIRKAESRIQAERDGQNIFHREYKMTPKPTMDSEPGKILLVDDSQLSRKMWRMLISKKYRCEIIEAENGYEAIQMLNRRPDIELILLNVDTPVMNGIQFLEILKNGGKFRHIPVIIVGAKGYEDDVLKGLGLGAKAYLRRPFTPHVAWTVIENVLKLENAMAV